MFAQFGAAFATGAEPADLEGMLVAGFTAMLRAASDTPETYRVALLGGVDADPLIDARIRRGREHLAAQLTEMASRWLEGASPRGISTQTLSSRRIRSRALVTRACG